MKNKTTALILSVLVGGLGIDRFYLGCLKNTLGKSSTVTCGLPIRFPFALAFAIPDRTRILIMDNSS